MPESQDDLKRSVEEQRNKGPQPIGSKGPILNQECKQDGELLWLRNDVLREKVILAVRDNDHGLKKPTDSKDEQLCTCRPS